MDIDGTLIDNCPEKDYSQEQLIRGNPILAVIRDVMVEEGWDPAVAGKSIEGLAGEIIWWDYPDFMAEFHLPTVRTWERICQWHDENLSVYQDTVATVRALHGLGKKLFIASNNPIVGCIYKLRRAGLSDGWSAPCFRRILGTNNLRGQKSLREFWLRAVAQSGIEPKRIATIGDNENEDGDVPLAAGIGRAFIIDRHLDTESANVGGKLFIREPSVILSFFSR